MKPTGKTCDCCGQPTYVTYAVTAYSGRGPIREHHYCKGCWYYADELTNNDGKIQPLDAFNACKATLGGARREIGWKET